MFGCFAGASPAAHGKRNGAPCLCDLPDQIKAHIFSVVLDDRTRCRGSILYLAAKRTEECLDIVPLLQRRRSGISATRPLCVNAGCKLGVARAKEVHRCLGMRRRLLPVVCRDFLRVCTQNAGMLWSTVRLNVSSIENFDGFFRYEYPRGDDMRAIYAWVARRLPAIQTLVLQVDPSLVPVYESLEVRTPSPANLTSFRSSLHDRVRIPQAINAFCT